MGGRCEIILLEIIYENISSAWNISVNMFLYELKTVNLWSTPLAWSILEIIIFVCWIKKSLTFLERLIKVVIDWSEKSAFTKVIFFAVFFFLNTWEHYPVGMCRIVLDEIWKDAFSFEKKDLVNSQICMQKTI